MLASRRSNSTSIFAVPQKYHLSPLKVKLISIVMNTHTHTHTHTYIKQNLFLRHTARTQVMLIQPCTSPICCQCLTVTLQGRSHPFRLPSYIPFRLPMRLGRVSYPSWTAKMPVIFRPYFFRIHVLSQYHQFSQVLLLFYFFFILFQPLNLSTFNKNYLKEISISCYFIYNQPYS